MNLLETVIIREVVKREVREGLKDGKIDPSSSPLLSKLFEALQTFPIFRNFSFHKQSASFAGVYEKLVKSKRGLSSIQMFLVSFLGNPLISVSRQHHKTDQDTNQSELPHYLHAAAQFLREVSLEDRSRIIEELKSIHPWTECRPLLRVCVQSWVKHTSALLVGIVRKDYHACQRNFQSIPQQVILTALKSSLVTNASLASVILNLVMMKLPFSSQSLFQLFLRTVLKLDSIEAELVKMKEKVGDPNVVKHCEMNLSDLMTTMMQKEEEEEEETSVVGESPETAKVRRDALLKTLPFHVEEESRKWAILRLVDLMAERQNQQSLLEVFDDDEFVQKICRESLTSSQTQRRPGLIVFVTLLLHRSSGFAKFVKVLFHMYGQGLALANSVSDNEELATRYSRMLERLVDKAIFVLRTMLQQDSTRIVHEIIEWLANMYANLETLTFPDLDRLVPRLLTPSEQHELFQLLHAAQHSNNKALIKLMAQKFVPTYRLWFPVVIDSLFLKRTELVPAAENVKSTGGQVMHVEVCALHSLCESSMSTRGFWQRGQTNSISLWIRHHTAAASFAFGLPPIVDAKLHFDKSTEEPGWIRLPLNFNSKTRRMLTNSSSVYLCLKRQAGETRVMLDMRLVDHDASWIHQALLGAKWTCAGTFRTGLFSSMDVWILYKE